MAGYIGTKAALLSTTTASVGGDSTVGGDLFVDAVYNQSGDNDSGLDLSTNDVVAVKTGNAERLRVDSSGNLLVGKTSVGFSGDGFEARASGQVYITDTTATPLVVRRNSTDGTIVEFYKDGSTVGSIGNRDADDLYINTAGGTGSLSVAGNQVYSWSGSYFYARTDNARDLGTPSSRWDDVYATNGTIQTSDRNEKQDIAALTATEMLVAARISAMFKTFRWIDKVADNPNARTHTGIIAQDVQQAFTDEGLDAGDYSLFISDTWTDDDGNSQTRMGIRYPELLSFIAAYNEQRFTNIEARLTALEAV